MSVHPELVEKQQPQLQPKPIFGSSAAGERGDTKNGEARCNHRLSRLLETVAVCWAEIKSSPLQGRTTVGGFGFGFAAAAAAMRQEIIGSNISILVAAETPTRVICRGS